MLQQRKECKRKNSPIPRTTKGIHQTDSHTWLRMKIKVPKDWEELQTFATKEKDLWLNSTKEEMEALKRNKTWELVDLPKGKQATGNKWTFKTKSDASGNVIRYKARLVAKGYCQKNLGTTTTKHSHQSHWS
ncbi:uncharacterized mitochondrial protein AtMg00820-like [Stegodyphus dumicola]|uniref:uncharacterized mitochondrial protein AtMg00820-like n=1 Tax=Stegodyphus dumicola TaxID=202533 RepID=UPI0015B20CEE|nr:uncharacterized mitochondrial protein AtMg00820-like [Stegodyphus dumicola]